MQAPRRRPPEPLPVEPSLRPFPGVEGFLHAVAEEPWDDTHRLVLADWLDDRGAADRAEFIRLQCLHDRLGFNLLTPAELARYWELAQTRQRAWLAGLPPSVTFFRGLATGLSADPATADPVGALLQGARSIDLQELTLPRAAAWDALLGQTELHGVVSVQAIARTDFSRLCRLLDRLAPTSLSLTESALGLTEIEQLVRLEGLVGLTRLNLRGNLLAGSGSRWLGGQWRISGGPGILAGSPLAATLEHLDLSQNALGGGDLAEVADGDWPRLRTLDLSYNHVSPDLNALFRSPLAARLEGISLRHNALTSRDIPDLLFAMKFDRLRRLAIGGHSLDAYDVEDLRQRLPGVEILA